MRRRWLPLVSTVVVIGVVAAVGLYAYLSQGNPVRHARLNDAGVWVSTDHTSGATGTAAMFGEMDVPAAQFASTLTPPDASTGLDVLQLGEAVAGLDGHAGSLTPIDPNTMKAGTSDAIKLGNATPVIGGNASSGTLAVLDPTKGALWAMAIDATTPLTNLSPVDPSGTKPLAKVGAAAHAAVGIDGTVYAVSGAVGLTTVTAGRTGWKTATTKLPQSMTGDFEVSSVGDRPVVLAVPAGSDSPELRLPDGQVIVLSHRAPDAAVKLQQPGPDAADVLVATGSSLLSIALSDGAIRELVPGASGSPAAPVQFEGCQFAAWSAGAGSEARVCGTDVQLKPLPSQSGASISDLVFRQNHQQLLLNDRTSGQVWRDQTGQPSQIADWRAVQAPKQSTKSSDDPVVSEQDRTKAPKAVNDSLGARPGIVTVLHVLDNDSTPPGTVLTVHSVDPPTTTAASITVSPDRQSILVDAQANATGEFTFDYDATNGSPTASNKATVTVTLIPTGTYFPPALRENYSEPSWSVPVNGVLTIPVLNEWRVNPDGDPPALGALSPDSVSQPGAAAIATADGSLVYRAGKNPGVDTLKYTVVDGDKVTTTHLTVNVQARNAKAVAPLAENDFVRTAVGQPLTIHPLANDLPGSDPLDPTATLKVAGVIKGRPGLQVSPPTADGAVTITATAAGSFALSYQDSYGSVNSATAVIRVDAVTADPHAQVAAAPVSVTVRGQTPALVDPLAGDSSPYGGLLSVVGVHVPANANLEVAVVRSAFLRVNVKQSSTVPGAQNATSETFQYVVTDGHSTATAQVRVVEMPPLANDVPIAETVYADVRAGDAVAVPVLDSAVDPAGDTLSLVSNVADAPSPGQLPVDGTTPGQNPGRAFVSGSEVRYLAPPASSTQTQQQQVTVTFEIVNSTGGTDTGSAVITIHPPGTAQTDQAPDPRELTARVVAGSTVTIPVPTSGVDPDGDTVQVQGLGQPASGDPQPKLGAIIATSANSLTYQAYPSATTAGTDTFTYVVADTFGVTARATVRIAVVQPTVLPAPVAHSFTVTAAPGAQLAINVVSPAHVDYPDGAPPTLLDPNKALSEGKSIATLDKRPGWLDLTVPRSAATGSVAVNYQVVADLGEPSIGTIKIQLKPGYVIPPVAVDEFAKPKPKATTVQLSLLAGDYSPTRGKLSVIDQPRIKDGVLTAALSGVPQVVPFVIKDSHGGTAAAVAYIPAAGSNAVPYWNGKTIQVPAGRATAIDINRYLVDLQGELDQLTERRDVWSSPIPGLTAAITGKTIVQLTGSPGYQGPASLTFAVNRTGDLNNYTLVTIPVLVGNPTPVLRCPTDVVQVEEGLLDGSTISPLSQCHVWTPPSVNPSALRFHLAFKHQADKVSILRNDAAKVAISADHDAKPGATGVLTVTIDGYASRGSDLNLTVVAARLLSVAPISVQGILTTGQPTTIDLRSYIDSPFGFNDVSIVQVGSIDNVQVSHTKGSITASTSKRDLHGVFQLTYTVTDLSNQQDRSRWRNGTITLQFIGVPGQPSAVTPRPGYLSEQVPVTWVAPPDNGANIDKYEVDYTSDAGSGSQSCDRTQCSIIQLHNGSNYHFSVKAHNIAGWGELGVGATIGTPDIVPGVVANFRAQQPPGDRAVTLTWTPIDDKSSTDGFSYTISWTGGVSNSHVISDRSASSYTVTGLNNDAPESFSISASNRAGQQPTASRTSSQSAGKPVAPTFSGTFIPGRDAQGNPSVTLTWNGVDPNGPGPVTYTVIKDGSSNICLKTTATQCVDHFDTNGSTHTYTVAASNKWNAGPSSRPTTVEAALQPNQMTAPTINAVRAADPDGQVTVNFTTVRSNGSSLTVNCTYTTDGSAPSPGDSTCPGSPWSGYGTGGGSSDSKTLTGLSTSSSATIRVAMWETNGSTKNGTQNSTGDISPASNAVNTNAPPSPPSNVQCVPSQYATLSWAWTGSTGTNGRTVQYRVVYDGADAGTTGATNYSRGAPDSDGNTHNLQVFAVDSHNDQSTGSNVAGCQDPGPPVFRTTHGGPGTCTKIDSTCQKVYVQVFGAMPNRRVTCSAVGSGAGGWGPATLTAGSDGNTQSITNDDRGVYLFDTSGSRYDDKDSFRLGDNNNGLVCR